MTSSEQDSRPVQTCSLEALLITGATLWWLATEAITEGMWPVHILLECFLFYIIILHMVQVSRCGPSEPIQEGGVFKN